MFSTAKLTYGDRLGVAAWWRKGLRQVLAQPGTARALDAAAPARDALRRVALGAGTGSGPPSMPRIRSCQWNT